ncbi:MAG: hypothetical protein PVH70_17085 [Desulfobacterales bacterium]
MKYYVYFDAYGHARQAISAAQLAETYQNDTTKFLQAMCRRGADGDTFPLSGHVGTLSFNSPKELQDYLDSLGDELDGFYEAGADSRPYNF